MEKINDIVKRKETIYAVKSWSNGTIIKDVDVSKKIVTGLYNTFNYFDSDYDVILPGASQKSITERGPNSSAPAKIKHLLFHDWTKLPGKIQVLEERTITYNNQKITGIYFETKMSETQDGIDTIIKYQDEVYDNHSIGFRFLDGEWLDEDSENWDKMIANVINHADIVKAGMAYFWKEIMLYEGSTVAFGANSLTPALGVKSQNKDLLAMKVNERIERLSKQLRSGTVSDESMQQFEMETLQLKQIISELFLTGPSEQTTRKRAGTKDTQQMITCDGCGTDFDSQNMEPNEEGAYACPDCNALSMRKQNSTIFSNLQFI